MALKLARIVMTCSLNAQAIYFPQFQGKIRLYHGRT